MIKNLIAGATLFAIVTLLAYMARSSVEGVMGNVLDVILGSGKLVLTITGQRTEENPREILYVSMMVNGGLGLLVGMYFAAMAKARRLEMQRCDDCQDVCPFNATAPEPALGRNSSSCRASASSRSMRRARASNSMPPC